MFEWYSWGVGAAYGRYRADTQLGAGVGWLNWDGFFSLVAMIVFFSKWLLVWLVTPTHVYTCIHTDYMYVYLYHVSYKYIDIYICIYIYIYFYMYILYIQVNLVCSLEVFSGTKAASLQLHCPRRPSPEMLHLNQQHSFAKIEKAVRATPVRHLVARILTTKALLSSMCRCFLFIHGYMPNIPIYKRKITVSKMVICQVSFMIKMCMAYGKKTCKHRTRMNSAMFTLFYIVFCLWGSPVVTPPPTLGRTRKCDANC